jgi:hypothetical protein
MSGEALPGAGEAIEHDRDLAERVLALGHGAETPTTRECGTAFGADGSVPAISK